MDRSTPGFPVPHHLPDFAQGHVHRISDAIQPSLLPSIFQASGSFQMSRLFASGGQSIGSSASASVLPMNIQGWFPLGWTGLISLLSKGHSRVFSSTTVQKHQFFRVQCLNIRGFMDFWHSFEIYRNGITQGIHSCKAIISWNWGAALHFPTIPTQISVYALCLALIGHLI